MLCVMEETGEGGRGGTCRCAVCDGGDRGGKEGRYVHVQYRPLKS